MHTPSGRNLLGLSLSLNTALLWGILPIALKEVIVTMDAATIVWYRFLTAALVIGFYLALRGRLPRLMSRGRAPAMLLGVAGVGLCGNYLLFSLSLNYLNAESTETVIQLTTLFLLLGGVLLFREPFDGLQKLGALLIVLGLVLFFNDRFDALVSLDSSTGIGVLLVVGAALTWTVYALLQKYLLRHFTSVQILFSVYLLATLILSPLARPSMLLALSPLQTWLLLFCCLNTLLAYGSFAEALAHWHASKVGAVLALAPLFTIAVLKTMVFFNPEYANTDRLNYLSVFAALILVVGSVMVALVPLLRDRNPGQSLSGS